MYEATAEEVSASSTEFGLAPNQPRSRFALYFDDSPDANAPSGAGFQDGQVILEGRVTSAGGRLFDFGDNVRFDQFGNDNYAGKQSDDGTGSLKVASTVDTADGAFFQSGGLQQMKFNASSLTPFEQINPSGQFDGQSVTPTLGSVNGQGQDPQLQSDGNASLLVPEPASLTLLAPAGLLMLRRRRRAA